MLIILTTMTPYPALEYLDMSDSHVESLKIYTPELNTLILTNCIMLKTLSLKTPFLTYINIDRCEKIHPKINMVVPPRLKDFSCRFNSQDPEVQANYTALDSQLSKLVLI